MFPVHIKYPGVVIPEKGTCFVIAREGILLRRETSWMHATVPVDSIGVLDSEPIGVQFKVPLITSEVLHQVIAFLRAAYQRYQTEAIALLYYSEEHGWHIDVPAQKVSRYTISAYDTKLKVPGYVCLGSIHSHADLAASHSGVDQDDEAEFDGIHITFGHCHNRFGVSVSAEVAVNGNRFGYPLLETEGIEFAVELPGVFEYIWNKNKVPSTFIKLPEVPSVFPLEWLERIEASPVGRLPRLVTPRNNFSGDALLPETAPEGIAAQQLPSVAEPDSKAVVVEQSVVVQQVKFAQLRLTLTERVLIWLNSLKSARRK
jgi:hypothetical protein